MGYTLANLLQDVYLALGQLTVSTATGGSTSSLVDSKQVGLHGDNEWKDGALLLIRDADGAGAAPEGEISLCTGYTDSSGTFASVWTVGPANGDIYGFTNDFYPLYTVMELCNMGLMQLGDIALVDTSQTTAESKTEYALPVTAKRGRPLEIALQSATGDSDDNAWQVAYDWDLAPAAPGSTATIVFRRQPTSSRTIRITYEGSHPKLTAATSVISETLHPELAKAAAVEACLKWQNSRLQGGDPFLLQRWNDAKNDLLIAKAEHPVWKPRRRPRLFILGDSNRRFSKYSGDVLP
jgi:hypothetical protein